jgi:hypothetical protein
MAYGGDGADRSSRKTWNIFSNVLNGAQRWNVWNDWNYFFPTIAYCLLPNAYCLFDVNQDVALVRPGKVGERSDGYS